MTLTINDIQHKNALPVCCVSFLRVSRFIYCYAEYHVLFIVLLNAIMLSVIMQSVAEPF